MQRLDREEKTARRLAIQGELGSNSHMAAIQLLRDGLGSAHCQTEIVPCRHSAEVFASLDNDIADFAVLPIENSLHGSVAEHYDLLLAGNVRVTGETLLRIRHQVIAAPGVKLVEVKRVLSHPVALSQCRGWIEEHPEIEAVAFYDTAGSVKHLMECGLRDVAGIAPELAARQYGAEVLVAGVEDHTENHTRFYVLEKGGKPVEDANKMSLAFGLEHRPGTLIEALQELGRAGLNLTRIESRPVQGQPWEYVFFVDLRFERSAQLDEAVQGLRGHCLWVKELGRYRAA